MSKKNEKIYTEFMDYVREKLDDTDFWKWVSGWLDPMVVIDITKCWDISEMKGELAKWKKADKNPDKEIEEIDATTNEIMDMLRNTFEFKSDSDIDDEIYTFIHGGIKELVEKKGGLK